MSALALPTYKVRKSDTLSGIAKKFKHRDWRTIWKADENKKVVKKRRKPERIQPGDVFTIPLNDRERKQVIEQEQHLSGARDAELKYIAFLEGEMARRDRMDRETQATILGSIKAKDLMIKEQMRKRKELRNFADQVDAANQIISMGISLGKLARNGRRFMKDLDKLVEEGNKELIQEGKKKLLKETSGVATGPLKGLAISTVAKLDKNDNDALRVIGEVAGAWDDMGKPSFWSNTLVRMVKHGDSWSDASQAKVGDEMLRVIKQIDRNHDQHMRMLMNLRTEYAKWQKKLEDQKKASIARIKGVERDHSELPPVK